MKIATINAEEEPTEEASKTEIIKKESDESKEEATLVTDDKKCGINCKECDVYGSCRICKVGNYLAEEGTCSDPKYNNNKTGCIGAFGTF